MVDVTNSRAVEDTIDNIPLRHLSSFDYVIGKTNLFGAQNKLKTVEKSEVGISPKSDFPARTSMNSDVPLPRRKRKLYSSKYECIESEISATELDNESHNFKYSKMQTPQYTSTGYKDIEKEVKKILKKQLTGKSKVKSETPSSRTKKMNDVFDQLNEKVECSDSVILADKKSIQNDLAIYNFTSDSEDEDLKTKKIEVQKRISSTPIASANSINCTRTSKSHKRLEYSETVSSDEVNKKSVSKQKKKVKRKTPKKRVTKRQNNLIDERMRDVVSDKLSTSIVEKPLDDISEEPLLKLDEKPQMEAITDEIVIEAENNVKPKKQKKKQNETNALSLKKEKERDNDDRTISPLPELVVEAMPTRSEDHNDLDTANMLQKFQKIYQEEFINETNTTQNLLSDVERINYSPVQMNITNNLNKFDNKNDDLNVQEESTNDASKSTKSKQKVPVIELEPFSVRILRVKEEKANSIKSKIKNDTEREKEVIHLSTTSNARSEKSIATVGKSPITAHGDFDEVPPDFGLLTEKFEPRDLETQDLNQSLKEYFYKLRDKVSNVPTDDRRNSFASDDTLIIQRLDRSDSKSPVVSIKRLTFDDFEKWLPSRENSETDSSSSKKIVKDNRQEISSIATRDDKKLTLILNKKKTQEGTTSDQEADDDRAIQKIEKISLEFDNVGNKANKNQSEPADFDELNEIVDEETLSDSNKSTSEKRTPEISRHKKKSDSPTNVDYKRRKLDSQLEKVVASESVPRVSKVNEWFRRNATVSSAENITASFHESIQHVKEKLDTTLHEIHENTCQKFVHMFVDMQKHLVEVKHERREIYKSVASEVLRQVVKVIDDKFADLDKRSQEMDVQIQEHLQSQAAALLRADCAHKQALVALLREDLQATVARMAQK